MSKPPYLLVHFPPVPLNPTKMSSSTENTALLAILAELQKLNGRISTLESTKPSAPAASGKAAKKERKTKEKDPKAPKRAPSSWLLFTGRIRDILRANGYEKAALGKECQMFCASLKEENAELDSWSEGDVLARRAAWTAPEVSKQKAAGLSWRKDKSGSAPGSVVSGAEEADGESAPASAKKERKNPWAGLTEEQKAERIAKMKAGKAAKKAAAEGEEAPASPKASEAPKAKTEAAPAAPKTAAKAASEAPKAAAASSASASAGEFKPVMLSGNRYLVNLANGHAYHRLSDGGQGEWAGLFSKVPKPHIDDSVAEPGAEAEEEELNFDADE
jgi:hypothetical protein